MTNVNTPNQQFASNFASNQNSGLSQTDNSSELSQNPNIRVLALSNNQNISIVNGGIKMPDGVDNTSEENK